jgi:hypothetical protein
MDVKRISKILAIVAVVSIAGVAFADAPRLPKVGLGETYLKVDIWKNVQSEPTPLPQVAGPQTTAALPTPGPSMKDLRAADSAAMNGTSLLRGGFGVAFLTPAEKTQQEIRKAMRRLG